ncbi:hypothetical protein D3Z62_24480 [Lachnospiraceae bacterium]|nr:hypothetical protein [Lachnospiraceae bacterium]
MIRNKTGQIRIPDAVCKQRIICAAGRSVVCHFEYHRMQKGCQRQVFCIITNENSTEQKKKLH